MKLTDDNQVLLVTAGCLLLIVFLFTSIISKRIDLLAVTAPFFLFLLYSLTRGRAKKTGGGQTLAWKIVIALVTLLIIIIYAVR